MGVSQEKSSHISAIAFSKANKLLKEECESWIGTPYKYGGNDRDGIDCSGLVLQIYLKVYDIKLPRTSLMQSEFCKEIKPGKIKVGDLVFFATGHDINRISHVGLMLDEENFIHSSSKKGVVISSLNTPYYQRTFKMFGRPGHDR